MDKKVKDKLIVHILSILAADTSVFAKAVAIADLIEDIARKVIKDE